jgi:hypothetical protein
MKNTNAVNYLSESEYMQAVSTLTEFAKAILIAYVQCSSETRDSIIRNFIARSISALNGIIQLWRVQDYHDCWLLYRAILDRFVQKYYSCLLKDHAASDSSRTPKITTTSISSGIVIVCPKTVTPMTLPA